MVDMQALAVFFHANLSLLLLAHVAASFVIALAARLLLKKRFPRGFKMMRIDRKILKDFVPRNFFAKQLFLLSIHRFNQRNTFLFFFIFTLSIPFLGFFALSSRMENIL